MDVPRLRMAMKIGNEHGVEATSGRHWRRFAHANWLDPDETPGQAGVIGLATN